jgi:hypothetical protein
MSPKNTIDAKCLKSYSQVINLFPNLGLLSGIRHTLGSLERRNARYRQGFKEVLIECLLIVALFLGITVCPCSVQYTRLVYLNIAVVAR